MADLKITLPGDKELVVEGVLDAPRELVFDALVDPKQLMQWWGPHGYDIISCDVDARPGGRWRIQQKDLEGNVHSFSGEFREVVPHAKIVQTWVYEGAPDAAAIVTITLDERNGRTTMRNHSLYPSKAARDGFLDAGMEWGTRQAHDRLTLLLGDRTGRLHSARAERTFDASVDDVWRAWTEGAQIAKWLAPWPDIDTDIKECDARLDGKLRFVMTAPDGTRFPESTWTFVLVDKPRRLMLDLGEGIFMRATLTPVGARTKLVVEQLGIPTREQREFFLGGLNGSLDKMVALVGKGSR